MYITDIQICVNSYACKSYSMKTSRAAFLLSPGQSCFIFENLLDLQLVRLYAFECLIKTKVWESWSVILFVLN